MSSLCCPDFPRPPLPTLKSRAVSMISINILQYIKAHFKTCDHITHTFLCRHLKSRSQFLNHLPDNLMSDILEDMLHRHNMAPLIVRASQRSITTGLLAFQFVFRPTMVSLSLKSPPRLISLLLQHLTHSLRHLRITFQKGLEGHHTHQNSIRQLAAIPLNNLSELILTDNNSGKADALLIMLGRTCVRLRLVILRGFKLEESALVRMCLPDWSENKRYTLCRRNPCCETLQVLGIEEPTDQLGKRMRKRVESIGLLLRVLPNLMDLPLSTSIGRSLRRLPRSGGPAMLERVVECCPDDRCLDAIQNCPSMNELSLGNLKNRVLDLNRVFATPQYSLRVVRLSNITWNLNLGMMASCWPLLHELNCADMTMSVSDEVAILNRLETLSITDVTFDTAHSLSALLKSCPNAKRVTISDCSFSHGIEWSDSDLTAIVQHQSLSLLTQVHFCNLNLSIANAYLLVQTCPLLCHLQHVSKWKKCDSADFAAFHDYLSKCHYRILCD